MKTAGRIPPLALLTRALGFLVLWLGALGSWLGALARVTFARLRRAPASPVVPEVSVEPALDRFTARLRAVAKLLADGHPQKLVAYELGIPEGSVYRLVAQLKRELSARSTVELVARLRAMREARAGDARGERVALESLTVGERFAVESALAGLSAKEIADARAGSARTAENLLATAYKKLGVSSRKELAARFGRP